MIFSSLSITSPLSLYSIPAVWLTAMYPNALKFNIIRTTTGYNNVFPRNNIATFGESKGVSPKLAAKVRKLEGAHHNGLEAFPLWTAAILVGNLAGLNNGFLNKMSLTYIAARIIYNYIYVNQETNAVGYLRSIVFFSSAGIPMTLLIKGAAKVATQ